MVTCKNPSSSILVSKALDWTWGCFAGILIGIQRKPSRLGGEGRQRGRSQSNLREQPLDACLHQPLSLIQAGVGESSISGSCVNKILKIQMRVL